MSFRRYCRKSSIHVYIYIMHLYIIIYLYIILHTYWIYIKCTSHTCICVFVGAVYMCIYVYNLLDICVFYYCLLIYVYVYAHITCIYKKAIIYMHLHAYKCYIYMCICCTWCVHVQHAGVAGNQWHYLLIGPPISRFQIAKKKWCQCLFFRNPPKSLFVNT